MAAWPWADVLAADLMLDEVERVEGLQERSRQLQQAQLMAYAFHKPQKLSQEARELDRERRGPLDVPTETVAQEQERAVVDLLAYAERIERRKRRSR